MNNIKEVIVGQTPTLLEAEKANELIKRINSLLNIRIETTQSETGEVIYGEDEITIVVPFYQPPPMQTQELTYCATDQDGNQQQVTKTFLLAPQQRPQGTANEIGS